MLDEKQRQLLLEFYENAIKVMKENGGEIVPLNEANTKIFTDLVNNFDIEDGLRSVACASYSFEEFMENFAKLATKDAFTKIVEILSEQEIQSGDKGEASLREFYNEAIKVMKENGGEIVPLNEANTEIFTALLQNSYKETRLQGLQDIACAFDSFEEFNNAVHKLLGNNADLLISDTL